MFKNYAALSLDILLIDWSFTPMLRLGALIQNVDADQPFQLKKIFFKLRKRVKKRQAKPGQRNIYVCQWAIKQNKIMD